MLNSVSHIFIYVCMYNIIFHKISETVFCALYIPLNFIPPKITVTVNENTFDEVCFVYM